MIRLVRPGTRIMRAAAVALLAAVLAATVGRDGFWLAVPLAMALAGAEASAGAGLAAGVLVLAAAVLSGSAPLPAALLGGVAALAVVLVVRVRLERELDAMRQHALRDPLTGLANRRALGDRLRHEVARHLRHGQRFTVLAMDLDGFKAINDRFGHDTGDELLREVATALRAAVRGQDTVARLGGDEFCVVAPDTDYEGAEYLADRVLRALAGVTAGVSGLSASVGAAIFPDDGRDAAALLAAADAAAIDAKRRRYAGRSRRAA